jgi:putative membrane protein insertion efficiency factor
MGSSVSRWQKTIGARLLNRGLRLLILGYQRFVSPFLAPRCRFWPSCSQYSLEALAVWGTRRGLWLSVCRLARCHPWSAGGIDQVPHRPLVSSDTSSYLAHVLRRRR